MQSNSQDADALPSRTTRATLSLAAWTAAWVASLALATFGPGVLWNDQLVPTLVAIALNVLVGIGMLFANKRNLQAMDELQRAMQLEAMAWSLGVGLVGGVAWTLFDRHDLVAIEAEIAHIVVIMAVVYMIGTFAGMRRYR